MVFFGWEKNRGKFFSTHSLRHRFRIVEESSLNTAINFLKRKGWQVKSYQDCGLDGDSVTFYSVSPPQYRSLEKQENHEVFGQRL
jgi:hypothetical protein